MSDVSLRKFAGQQTASGIDRRNLRGRCGGFGGRRAQAPSHDQPSRFGRLPRQGQAPQYEADKKGACPSLAKSPPTREGRRDERPDCRATNAVSRQSPCAGFPEGRKHPGCRDGAPLRGGRRDGDLGRRVTRKGSPPFQKTRERDDDQGVLDESGGGEPSLSLRRHCLRTGGSVLRSRLVGPHTHFAVVSTILGATGGGFPGVASHATPGRAAVLGASPPGGLAPLRGRRHRCGAARCPPSLEREGGYRTPRTPNKRAREAGAVARRRVETPSPPRRRSEESAARGRARASGYAGQA
jgi:hypothetical protein